PIVSDGGHGRQDITATGLTSGVESTGSLYLTALDLSTAGFVAADAPNPATITFGGFGFQSNENVSLSIAQPGLPLATSVAADSSGPFTYTLTVPAHTAGGDYTIVATGQTSGLTGSGVLHVGQFVLTPSDAMLSGTVSDVTLAAV